MVQPVRSQLEPWVVLAGYFMFSTTAFLYVLNPLESQKAADTLSRLVMSRSVNNFEPPFYDMRNGQQGHFPCYTIFKPVRRRTIVCVRPAIIFFVGLRFLLYRRGVESRKASLNSI